MQPKLEKIPVNHLSSITVKREITPYMDYPWHYHPEFEIIFVEKSYGIRAATLAIFLMEIWFLSVRDYHTYGRMTEVFIRITKICR